MSNIFLILIGYLLGSVPFGLIIARLSGVKNLRQIGSGNIGATNVYRAAGALPAVLVTIFDILKGAVPILLAMTWGGSLFSDLEYLKLLTGVAAILGHIFPVYLGFKGGKGVNTALGVFIMLLTLPTLIALVIFILTVSVSRYISLGSILASLAFAAAVIIFRVISFGNIHAIYIPTAILLVVLILFTHRSNLKRLLQGTENKFGLHKQAVDGAESNG